MYQYYDNLSEDEIKAIIDSDLKESKCFKTADGNSFITLESAQDYLCRLELVLLLKKSKVELYGFKDLDAQWLHQLIRIILLNNPTGFLEFINKLQQQIDEEYER